MDIIYPSGNKEVSWIGFGAERKFGVSPKFHRGSSSSERETKCETIQRIEEVIGFVNFHLKCSC